MQVNFVKSFLGVHQHGRAPRKLLVRISQIHATSRATIGSFGKGFYKLSGWKFPVHQPWPTKMKVSPTCDVASNFPAFGTSIQIYGKISRIMGGDIVGPERQRTQYSSSSSTWRWSWRDLPNFGWDWTAIAINWADRLVKFDHQFEKVVEALLCPTPI